MSEEAEAVFRVTPIVGPGNLDEFVAKCLQAMNQIAAGAESVSLEGGGGGFSGALSSGGAQPALGVGVARDFSTRMEQINASFAALSQTSLFDPNRLQRAMDVVATRFNEVVVRIESFRLPGFRAPDFSTLTTAGESIVRELTTQIRAISAVQFRSTQELTPYATQPARYGAGTPEFAALVASIRREGVREPIALGYNPNTGQAAITEGTHRLAAATAAGLTYVPTTAVRSYNVGQPGFDTGAGVPAVVRPQERIGSDRFLPEAILGPPPPLPVLTRSPALVPLSAPGASPPPQPASWVAGRHEARGIGSGRTEESYRREAEVDRVVAQRDAEMLDAVRQHFGTTSLSAALRGEKGSGWLMPGGEAAPVEHHGEVRNVPGFARDHQVAITQMLNAGAIRVGAAGLGLRGEMYVEHQGRISPQQMEALVDASGYFSNLTLANEAVLRETARGTPRPGIAETSGFQHLRAPDPDEVRRALQTQMPLEPAARAQLDTNPNRSYEVNLPGAQPGLVNEVTDTLDEMLTKYPEMVGKLVSVGFMSRQEERDHPRDWARASPLGEGRSSIRFREGWLAKGKAAIDAEVAQSIATGYLVPGLGGVPQLVHHEFAHTIAEAGLGGPPIPAAAVSKQRGLSSYGAENPDETFAEAFALQEAMAVGKGPSIQNEGSGIPGQPLTSRRQASEAIAQQTQLRQSLLASVRAAQISYEHTRSSIRGGPPDGGYSHRVYAMSGGNEIGRLEIDPESGTIGMVDVEQAFRRRGIGQGMLDYARRQGLNPQHSSQRTDLGEAFALADQRRTGAYVPPRDMEYVQDHVEALELLGNLDAYIGAGTQVSGADLLAQFVSRGMRGTTGPSGQRGRRGTLRGPSELGIYGRGAPRMWDLARIRYGADAGREGHPGNEYQGMRVGSRPIDHSEYDAETGEPWGPGNEAQEWLDLTNKGGYYDAEGNARHPDLDRLNEGWRTGAISNRDFAKQERDTLFRLLGFSARERYEGVDSLQRRQRNQEREFPEWGDHPAYDRLMALHDNDVISDPEYVQQMAQTQADIEDWSPKKREYYAPELSGHVRARFRGQAEAYFRGKSFTRPEPRFILGDAERLSLGFEEEPPSRGIAAPPERPPTPETRTLRHDKNGNPYDPATGKKIAYDSLTAKERQQVDEERLRVAQAAGGAGGGRNRRPPTATPPPEPEPTPEPTPEEPLPGYFDDKIQAAVRGLHRARERGGGTGETFAARDRLRRALGLTEKQYADDRGYQGTIEDELLYGPKLGPYDVPGPGGGPDMGAPPNAGFYRPGRPGAAIEPFAGQWQYQMLRPPRFGGPWSRFGEDQLTPEYTNLLTYQRGLQTSLELQRRGFGPIGSGAPNESASIPEGYVITSEGSRFAPEGRIVGAEGDFTPEAIGAREAGNAQLKRVEMLSESNAQLRATIEVENQDSALAKEAARLRAEQIVLQEAQNKAVQEAIPAARESINTSRREQGLAPLPASAGEGGRGFLGGFRRGLSGFGRGGGGGSEGGVLGGIAEGLGTQLGFGLSIGAGFAAFAELRASVTDAMQLNQQLSLLHGQFSLLGPGAGSFNQLRTSILGASEATGVAGTQIAGLASEFLGLYQNTGQASSALNEAAQTILLTGEHAQTVGPQLGAIITNLQGSASVGNINDAIATATSRTGRSTGDVLSAFAQLSPTFGIGGGNLQQLTSLFDIVGKGSALSGQQIGDLLERYLPEVTTHIVPLEHLGFQFSDLAKQGDIPAQIQDLLNSAGQIRANNPGQAGSILRQASETLGGIRGARFFQTLFQTPNAAQQFANGDIIQGAGTDLAERKLNTFAGRLGQIKATIAAIVQQIFDSGIGTALTQVAGGFEAVLRPVEALLSLFHDLNNATHGVVGDLVLVGGALAIAQKTGIGASLLSGAAAGAAGGGGGGGGGGLAGGLIGGLLGRGKKDPVDPLTGTPLKKLGEEEAAAAPLEEEAVAASFFGGKTGLIGTTSLGAGIVPAAAFTLIAANQVQRVYDARQRGVQAAQSYFQEQLSKATTPQLQAVQNQLSSTHDSLLGQITNAAGYRLFGVTPPLPQVSHEIANRAAAGTSGTSLDLATFAATGDLTPDRIAGLARAQTVTTVADEDFNKIINAARGGKIDQKDIQNLTDVASGKGRYSQAERIAAQSRLDQLYGKFGSGEIGKATADAATQVAANEKNQAIQAGEFTKQQTDSNLILADASKQYQAGQITFKQYLDALNTNIQDTANFPSGSVQNDQHLQDIATKMQNLGQDVVDRLNARLSIYQQIGGVLGQQLLTQDVLGTVGTIQGSGFGQNVFGVTGGADNLTGDQRLQLLGQSTSAQYATYQAQLQFAAQSGVPGAVSQVGPPVLSPQQLQAGVEAYLDQHGSADGMPEPYATYYGQNKQQFDQYQQYKGSGFSPSQAHSLVSETQYLNASGTGLQTGFTQTSLAVPINPLDKAAFDAQNVLAGIQGQGQVAAAQAGLTFNSQAVAQANLVAAQQAVPATAELVAAQYKQSHPQASDAEANAFAVQSSQYKSAQANALAAQISVDQANQGAAQAQASYIEQVRKYNPLAVAQAQIDGAKHEAAALGQNINDILKAAQEGKASSTQYQIAQQYVAGQQGLVEAQNEVANSQVKYLQALALAHGDPIQAARDQVALIKQELAQAKAEGAGPAQILDLQSQLTQAAADVVTTTINETEQRIQAQLGLNQITRAQAIAQLQTLRALAKTQDQRNQIDLEIKQLRGGAQNLQFDLPSNIQLPTLYEARRLNQTPVGTGYQDNRQVNINLQVFNGADMNTAMGTILDAVGGSPSRTFGTSVLRP